MKKGYTLIEILLVLGLLSLIAIIVIPNTSVFLRIKERQEVKEFRKDLLLTRNRAIMEKKSYEVYLDTVGNKYFIKNSTNPSVKSKEFGYGLRLSDRSNLKHVEFYANGAPAGGGTIILIDKDGGSYRVKVRPVTGSVEVDYSD